VVNTRPLEVEPSAVLNLKQSSRRRGKNPQIF
jgi:hypothetical protein